jgi:hypothetical protein
MIATWWRRSGFGKPIPPYGLPSEEAAAYTEVLFQAVVRVEIPPTPLKKGDIAMSVLR